MSDSAGAGLTSEKLTSSEDELSLEGLRKQLSVAVEAANAVQAAWAASGKAGLSSEVLEHMNAGWKQAFQRVQKLKAAISERETSYETDISSDTDHEIPQDSTDGRFNFAEFSELFEDDELSLDRAYQEDWRARTDLEAALQNERIGAQAPWLPVNKMDAPQENSVDEDDDGIALAEEGNSGHILDEDDGGIALAEGDSGHVLLDDDYDEQDFEEGVSEAGMHSEIASVLEAIPSHNEDENFFEQLKQRAKSALTKEAKNNVAAQQLEDNTDSLSKYTPEYLKNLKRLSLHGDDMERLSAKKELGKYAQAKKLEEIRLAKERQAERAALAAARKEQEQAPVPSKPSPKPKKKPKTPERVEDLSASVMLSSDYANEEADTAHNAARISAWKVPKLENPVLLVIAGHPLDDVLQYSLRESKEGKQRLQTVPSFVDDMAALHRLTINSHDTLVRPSDSVARAMGITGNVPVDDSKGYIKTFHKTKNGGISNLALRPKMIIFTNCDAILKKYVGNKMEELKENLKQKNLPEEDMQMMLQLAETDFKNEGSALIGKQLLRMSPKQISARTPENEQRAGMLVCSTDFAESLNAKQHQVLKNHGVTLAPALGTKVDDEAYITHAIVKYKEAHAPKKGWFTRDVPPETDEEIRAKVCEDKSNIQQRPIDAKDILAAAHKAMGAQLARSRRSIG